MSLFMSWFIFTFLPGLSAISIALSIVSVVFSIAWFIEFMSEDDKWKKSKRAQLSNDNDIKLKRDRSWRNFKRSLIVLTIMFTLAIIIPSERQLYMILGSHYMTNIEDIEKLPPAMVKGMNRFLQEYTLEDTNKNGDK